MKRIESVGIFRDSERMNLSVNGNPRHKVWIEIDGDEEFFKTATDAQCGYSVENYHNGDKINFSYHITSNGSKIIDYIHESRG